MDLKDKPTTEDQLLALSEAAAVSLQALGWIAVVLGRMTQETKDQLKESNIYDGSKLVQSVTTHEMVRVVMLALGKDAFEKFEADLATATLDKAKLAEILKQARIPKHKKEN